MKTAEDGETTATARLVERSGTHERVHGKYETVELFAGEFLKLSQVRAGKNPILEELKNSIERVGLLNSIDVARMDGALLAEYIEFTNMVWGANRSMDEFAHLEVDGLFYPLVAGHSRHQAIEELEQEERIDILPIEAKVHTVKTIEDILDLQLGENLHSVPTMERRALAAVEHYTFGVMKGRWVDQDDYYAQHPSRELDKSLLRDGLAISQLPPDIQAFIFQKKVSLATGLELAKTGRVTRKYIEFLKGEKFKDMDEAARASAEQLYLEKMVIQTSRIAEARLNASAAKKVLVASRQRMNDEMTTATTEDTDNATFSDATLFDLLMTVDDAYELEAARTRKELNDLLRKYGQHPSSFAMELIELTGAVASEEVLQGARVEYQQSLRFGAHMLGKTTLHAVDVEAVS